MKKIFLILLGISIILSGIIFILFKNNQSKTEEVIDLFKDNNEEKTEITDKVENKEKETTVIVDIKGMVKNPGVYEVDSFKRVNDVIELAGGLVEGADTSLINLAKIVTDEMTIIIYSKEEIIEKFKEEVCICNCPELKNDACIEKEPKEELSININTATKEEIKNIPGIGDSKAEEIIKYREENGNFKKIEDIKNVSGIGDSLFEKIKDYITI